LGELGADGAEPAPASAADAFARFAAATEGAAGLTYAALGLSGRVLGSGAGVPA
jgi:hypothetical protein